MSATTQTTPASATVPSSIRDANVVIVGGGPSGSLAAMLLDQAGIHVTVVERTSDFLKVNSSRAYAQGLFGRGTEAVRRVSGLIDFVEKAAIPWGMSAFSNVSPEGKISTRTMSRPDNNSAENPPFLILMRFRLLEVLKQFVQQRTNARTLYGASVTDMSFGDDGVTTLSIDQDDGQKLQLQSRLVIACDGRNSVVLQNLRQKTSNVHSVRGFQEQAKTTPAVGFLAKSIIIERDTLNHLDFELDPFKLGVIFLQGVKKGRPKGAAFPLILFPATDEDNAHFGGILASITRPGGHAVWRLNSVEEGYVLFEENFPLLDVRKAISPESMRNFVETTPVQFPPVARPSSIVATVGASEQSKTGGVIAIGDAAHCFPPTTGMGINAGFEDASILTDVILECGPNASVEDVVRMYEERRDPEVEALMRICEVAAPYAMGDDRLVAKLTFFKVIGRGLLAKLLPRVFHPSITFMLRSSLPFSEIYRRASVTTKRILIALVALVLIPVAGFFMFS